MGWTGRPMKSISTDTVRPAGKANRSGDYPNPSDQVLRAVFNSACRGAVQVKQKQPQPSSDTIVRYMDFGSIFGHCPVFEPAEGEEPHRDYTADAMRPLWFQPFLAWDSP